MALPVSNSESYRDDGLHNILVYIGFKNFNGNDIWINFESKMINHAITDNQAVCILASTTINNYLINEKIIEYDAGGYPAQPYKSLHRYIGNEYGIVADRTYFGPGFDSTRDRFDYDLDKTFIDTTNVYNIHLLDNTVYYYMNGNFIKSRPNYSNSKYFIIHWALGTSQDQVFTNKNTTNSLHWITLTDQMSSDIPKPPYTLDEKDNNTYGIQKQSE